MSEFTVLASHRPAWMVRAACADVPRDVFYPGRYDGAAGYREALNLCADCPVKAECLEWALEAEGLSDKTGRHGMFGGATPRERASMRPARICEICEAPFRGDPRTPTCSERCWQIRETRYQRVWNRNHRSNGTPSSHGSPAMYRRGCRCSVCSRSKRAKSREELVRATMRKRLERSAG